MRRVFTKSMDTGAIVTAGGFVTTPGAVQWIPQEDIEILGCSIATELLYDFAVNGPVHGYVELSQAATQTQDGKILGVQTVGLQWNAIGQGGGGVGSMGDNVVLILPAGYSIPVKEDGHVNVHMQIETPAGEAGNLYAWVTVYYLRVGA